MQFKINTPQGSRTIGEIRGDRLVKKVSRSRHYHRKTGAWGLQAEAVPRLKAVGVTTIELRLDTGEVLLASLDDYEKKGFVLDFGHGKQVFLKEKHWITAKPAEIRLF